MRALVSGGRTTDERQQLQDSQYQETKYSYCLAFAWTMARIALTNMRKREERIKGGHVKKAVDKEAKGIRGWTLSMLKEDVTDYGMAKIWGAWKNSKVVEYKLEDSLDDFCYHYMMNIAWEEIAVTIAHINYGRKCNVKALEAELLQNEKLQRMKEQEWIELKACNATQSSQSKAKLEELQAMIKDQCSPWCIDRVTGPLSCHSAY